MRFRGATYWGWADPQLHTRTHSEVVEAGFSIDVQVRLSRIGTTQMFIGVYGCSGVMIHEEAHSARPSQSMTTALLWGVARAREIASSSIARGSEVRPTGTAVRSSSAS